MWINGWGHARWAGAESWPAACHCRRLMRILTGLWFAGRLALIRILQRNWWQRIFKRAIYLARAIMWLNAPLLVTASNRWRAEINLTLIRQLYNGSVAADRMHLICRIGVPLPEMPCASQDMANSCSITQRTLSRVLPIGFCLLGRRAILVNAHYAGLWLEWCHCVFLINWND